MMRPTSFISEHTAEYALVCDLVAILSREHPNVIPVYFWTTREGSTVASKSVGTCKVRVVAAYARRPKVTDPTNTAILMKVNSLLLQAGAAGMEAGSPVFAGVPLAAGLLQFSLKTPCCWFHLKDDSPEDRDINIQISLSGQRQEGDLDSSGVAGPLTIDEILTVVRQHTRPMCWDEAICCIRHIRSRGEIGMRGFFFSGYRPFYLILPEAGIEETH